MFSRRVYARPDFIKRFATEINVRRGTNRPAIAMTRFAAPTMTLGAGDFASSADIAVATT
jgi:hypothetical protein